MSTEKLNILPVQTFSSLGVNGIERDTGEYETAEISVGENENRSVLQYINSDSKNEAVFLRAERSSEVKLVRIFDRAEPVVSKLNVSLAENASLELIQLFIGGSDTVSEIAADLEGDRSNFTAVIGCALKGSDRLDINLIARHRGRRTVSSIRTASVLNGEAHKTFKGTIDFRNGASGAKGSEHEDALLLGNRVINRTVPMILCEEENVEGNHGATVGRLDEKHIFYLRSRGISEEKIYELMARAKLMQAVGRIDDNDARARVYRSLGWGDADE